MKTRIFFLIFIAMTLAFAISVGPVAAESEKIAFEGTRSRTAASPGPSEVVGCNLLRKLQFARWTVSVGHELVDGIWENYETKVNRQIIDCDPSDPPDPSDVTSAMLGSGIIHGPFILMPFGDTGMWEGNWKVIWHLDPDGLLRRKVTASAIGSGGEIDGLLLKVDTEIEGIVVPVPFNGYIMAPNGFD
jgi:hypothetical protein